MCHSPQKLSIEEQHCQALYSYRLRFSYVNNSPRAIVFPAWEANFGQAMYRSLERSTQDNTWDGFDLYSAQASFAWPRVDLALSLFGSYPSSLSKSSGFVSLSGEASLVFISDAFLFLLRS